MLCRFDNSFSTGDSRIHQARHRPVAKVTSARTPSNSNGSEGTAVYSTQRPLELMIGKKGDKDLHRIDIPKDFLVYPGSPRDPAAGDPLTTFRYDQNYEFIDAIVNHRPCTPSFADGAACQRVMDAAVLSCEQHRWVNVNDIN